MIEVWTIDELGDSQSHPVTFNSAIGTATASWHGLFRQTRANRMSSGILWLDLDGGIVMVETDGRAPDEIVGSVIELDTPALEIQRRSDVLKLRASAPVA